jgi:hypothetical protein
MHVRHYARGWQYRNDLDMIPGPSPLWNVYSEEAFAKTEHTMMLRGVSLPIQLWLY